MKFYITTPIFYVNDRPHIGHAFTMIIADTLARYHRLKGDKTFFLTGTDEHGVKIVKAAESAGKDVSKFTDEVSKEFVKLSEKLNASNDYFVRTTDEKIHWPGVFKIWEAINLKGDLYKDTYQGLYCVGHEAFIKKSELKEGLCPEHKTKPEKVEEENYFFRLSKYKKELQKLYENGIIKIKPESRRNEVLEMLKDSEDVSFSRPRKDLKWGIAVPSDPEHTIYVWADALTNYLSGIGYGRDDNWKNFWPADIHVIGKDILRFHSIIWPAMLLSADLGLPKSIYVHGFITIDGEKMSKTVGNIVDPFELIEKYGIDAVRYYLLRETPSNEDGDFSELKFKKRYNSDLANNLGNLVSRTLTVIENQFSGDFIYKSELLEKEVKDKTAQIWSGYKKNIEDFRLHEALASIFKLVDFANTYIDGKKPWKESPENLLKTAGNLVYLLVNIGWLLSPFLPDTSDKIFKQLGLNKNAKDIENYHFEIKKGEVLFPRL